MKTLFFLKKKKKGLFSRMKAELPTRTEILEAIGIQLITFLSTESLLDII